MKKILMATLFVSLLTILLLQTAFAKSTTQILKVDFVKAKQRAEIKIASQSLGKIGTCIDPKTQKKISCPEPSFPGKCSLKEITKDESFEVFCVSQEGLEPTSQAKVDLVRNFKYPDSVLKDVKSTDYFDGSDEKLKNLIETKQEKWGTTYSWSDRAFGSRAWLYKCLKGKKDCVRVSYGAIIDLALTVKPINH